LSISTPLVTPLLDIQNLSCERGYRQLFQALSFSVSAGEVVRITGANGAGKSSLLNILAGLSTQYEGEIFFQGSPIQKMRYEFLAQMAYLAHEKAVKMNLTVLENLQWFAALYPCKVSSEQDLLAILDQVALKKFRLHRASDLSQGQKQRIALARLLMSEAKLWILDEPFTAIDQLGVKHFELMISEFAAAGGAVIITAHHPLAISGNYRELSLDDFKTAPSARVQIAKDAEVKA